MLQRNQLAAELFEAAAGAFGEGNFVAASTFARAAAQAAPTASASNLAGLAEFSLGNHQEALALVTRAASIDPSNPEFPNNLGFMLHVLGDFEKARAALNQALALNPTMAEAANNLGAVLEKLGDDEGAITWYRRALQIDPAYVDASHNLLITCAKVAPQWHFPMIADQARNQAYADALKLVAPRRRVLDIGAGTGLLAMMAARAGAAHVATCEMQPVMAGIAKAVIANNAMDNITVFAARSSDLQIGCDLPTRAEVLVTETFASGLLSEGILATVEDAHLRLLTQDAVAIPRRAAAIGYLIGGPIIEQHLFAQSWDGLDLSPFDLLAPSRLGLHLDRVPHDILSEDFEIFGFNLMDRLFPPMRRQIRVPVTKAGRAVGVAQWIKLELDETNVYENRPTSSAGANGWMHLVYRLNRPIEVAPNDRVYLVASHNRTNIAIGLDEPSNILHHIDLDQDEHF